jgi:hypothetical protein
MKHFGTQHSSHISRKQHLVNLHLDWRRNPRTASFIQTEQVAPMPPIRNRGERPGGTDRPKQSLCRCLPSASRRTSSAWQQDASTAPQVSAHRPRSVLDIVVPPTQHGCSWGLLASAFCGVKTTRRTHTCVVGRGPCSLSSSHPTFFFFLPSNRRRRHVLSSEISEIHRRRQRSSPLSAASSSPAPVTPTPKP